MTGVQTCALPICNPDANYPALPGIKSKKQFKAGAVVAVALPYGDLTPAIIGEVEL